MTKLDQYRAVGDECPKTYKAWQVFGAGLENVGKDGKTTTLELREPADNEILVRVDALGLCLSDIKIIKQGNGHPRLLGRDLSVDPTVLGHECSVTVVKCGARWKDQFPLGKRYIVQADIYVDGVTCAFGYRIPGGLAEYSYLDERALDGDEGCYLLPVKGDLGYGQAALSEPWACVEMSYSYTDRTKPGEGSSLVAGEEPASESGYDDIIVPSPSVESVKALAGKLNKDGNMFLLGQPTDTGTVTLDIGRIHYDGIRYYGGGSDVESVGKANERSQLLTGGSALFIGAGGPMGQMHVQRSIEVANGPKRVVVTDLDPERLAHLRKMFASLAEKQGTEFITLSPDECGSREAMEEQIRSLAPSGYDDIVVLAPVVALVPYAVNLAADNGVVNVFAGLPIGTEAEIELADLCRGVKILGTSGSGINDLQRILDMVERGELNPNLSVAAIGGLASAREGLEGVQNARFAGKTVIYTQIDELPLMGIEEIPQRIPELAEKLGTGGEWTTEAEEALLEMYL